MTDVEKTKVIVLGLDGARLDVILKWSSEGYLPTFKEIINKGVHGNLRTVFPIHSFPAWTSLSTGAYPPKHGIYDVLLRDRYGYKRIPPNSSMVKVRRFWDILDDLGYKCCIINVPVTYPPKSLKNGVIVSSVLTPSTNVKFAEPERIWNKLRKEGYKILPESKPGTKQYINEVYEIFEKQYEFVKWCLRTYDCDLLFWVIMSTEMLHHHYASFIDPNHFLFKPEYEKIVRELYMRIDKALYYFINTFHNITLFIVSDHGFAPYYGNLYINAILRKMGFLSAKPKHHIIKRELKLLLKKIGKNIYKYMPEKLKEKAIKIAGFGASEFNLSLIDWKNTVAYSSFLDDHINLNIKNREINGIINKEQYSIVLNEIIKKLRDNTTLSEIMQPIPRYALYKKGRYLELMSDIFILFGKDNSKPYKIRTDPYAKNFIDHNLKQFKENIGYHTLFGIFIAYGRNIKSRHVRNAKIVDIAPTILSIYGIKPPSYMDGSILYDIFVDKPNLVINYDKFIFSMKIRDVRKRLINDGEIR